MTFDPDGAEKAGKAPKKRGALMRGSAYGKRFTERQFFNIFNPLLARAVERVRMLEKIQQEAISVSALAKILGLPAKVVFEYMKELLKRDFVEIVGHKNRYALYKKKKPIH